MRDTGKGSITIWLSLVMCVILSLVLACIQSARLSAARAFVSICMDESLFSEFARYDRILFDKYGLLAVDAGFGGGSINFAAVADEIDEAAREAASVNEDLFRISLKQTDITGYVLATDSGAAPLKSQISSLMTAKLGVDGVNRLIDMVNTNEPIIRDQEERGVSDPENIKEAYENSKAEAAARRAEREAEREARGETGGETGGEAGAGTEGGGAEGHEEPAGLAEVPEDFKNPLDNVQAIMRMGIYNVILPDPTDISTRSIDLSSLAEKREFQSGMGILPSEESGAADHFLMAAYITDFFPDFLSGQTGEGLKYQAEFAVAGRGSDAENLKSVLDRLLLIRMGLNFVYLSFFAPEKKAEAEGVALIIASILMAPELTEAIAQVLLLAWAYGEGMMDLKTLLAGGKSPVLKDESTWQLSLEKLAVFSHETAPDTNLTGLTYDEYLTILLCMIPDGELTGRTLDLLEYNRRIEGGDPGFRIDSCLTAIETETSGSAGSFDFSIRRSYGYDNYQDG